MGADGVNNSQLWAQDANGALRAHGKAYSTLVSVLLTSSMSAKCFASSGPKLLAATLPKARWRQRAQTLNAHMRCGCTLECLCCCVGADQAGNHDSRGNAQTLAGEVNQLDWLLALQLLDLEWVAIETAGQSANASAGLNAVNGRHSQHGLVEFRH